VEPNSGAPLREMWYYAAAGERLRPGRMLAKTMLGEPVLLARARDGSVFALRDLCPHRGIPLSCGTFDGNEIECRFHAWRFDRGGRCTAIPSLSPDQDFDSSRIGVKTYPAREVQGNVWVFFGDDPATAPEIPVLPEAGNRRPDLVMDMKVRCSIDQAVFGQMDPTHNAFVHVSWWWRKQHQVQPKAKAFAPAPWGFTMVPHRPSGNLHLYRLLGGEPETQIIFRLPSTRIEHLRFGRHWMVTLNTVTPIGDDEIEMSYAAWWNLPLFTVLKPVLRMGLQTFTHQDRDILEMQSRGLRHNPAVILIDDADTQAKWYHRLKNEYARAHSERRPFVNPVKERVLRFQS
jgi:phenylpropionate dioxygenase-like ring-hydroxylating dioxygenase large terminal subunit